MTLIGLLRHFPTDWNLEGRIQGRVDRPLTGEARARLDRLALPEPWDGARLVASPLARARETAERLARGRRVALDPRLAELCFGDWQGRLSAELLADQESGFVPMERWGWHRRPPGGESPADGLARLRPLLAELGRDGRRTLLVFHRGMIRAALAEAWGWDFDRPEPFGIRRGRILPVAVDTEGRLSEPGVPVRLAERAR
jgi:probable phosphoglycerate mutase